MNGATPLLPVNAFMGWTRTAFSFLTFLFSQRAKGIELEKLKELYKILCGKTERKKTVR
jgi:uncharacterized membrane protein YidH (DUF202 family)